MKLGTLVTGVLLISAGIATFPLVDDLDDWFVNGLVFEDDIPVLMDVLSKTKLVEVIKSYHGSRITKLSERGEDFPWARIQDMVAEMFSKEYRSIRGKKLSFYGNDPVCMFKVFVLVDDPQFLFVWSYLSFHFLCFLCVAVCHVAIAAIANKSQVQGSKRSNTLNRKVTLICVTDFCCWMPFLICCALHTAEVVDMSPWYQVFSLNILPLNSLLNPLLYSDLPTRFASYLKACWTNPDPPVEVALAMEPQGANAGHEEAPAVEIADANNDESEVSENYLETAFQEPEEM